MLSTKREDIAAVPIPAESSKPIQTPKAHDPR